jgi:hypothetical protein
MRLRRRLRNCWLCLYRPLVIWLTLLSYGMTAVALPLPVRPVKDSRQPFPCQNRPCGCSDAEQFWSSCCCFSPQERLAWAKAHNVEPPAEFVAEAEKESPPDEATNVHNCCAQQNDSEHEPTEENTGCPSCSQSSDDTHKHGRSSGKKSCCCSPTPAAPKKKVSSSTPPGKDKEQGQPADSAAIVWVAGFSARQCQGEGTHWVSMAAALPAAAVVTWHFDWRPVGWLFSLSVQTEPHTFPPPLPPPRC